MKKDKKLIGLSLSQCIKDIIEGKVKEESVVKIITRTCARNEEEWGMLIYIYQKKYWSNNADQAREICLRLRNAGKIEQPRIKNERIYSLDNGHWEEAV